MKRIILLNQSSSLYRQHVMKYLKIKLILLLFFTSIALLGCGGIQASKNSKALSQLRIGQSFDEVISFMGKPARTQATGSKQYWLYWTTGFANNDYDHFTPIVFVDGKVQGWGKQYFKEIGIEKEITPIYSPPQVYIPQQYFSNPTPALPTNVPMPPRQNPFLNAPQQNLQTPSVNCNPNGIGGFRCQ